MQTLKWNKTRIFNWRPSKSITAAFQDTLIILFQCILFYSYFNIALNFLRTEHVSSFINLSVGLTGCSVPCLLQSGGQWLAAIFWRWKLLSWGLCLACMTCHMAVCPDDLCAAPGLQDISSSVQRALPHLFQCRNVSRQSDQQGSHFSCPLHTFAVSCAPHLLVEPRLCWTILWDVLGAVPD